MAFRVVHSERAVAKVEDVVNQGESSPLSARVKVDVTELL